MNIITTMNHLVLLILIFCFNHVNCETDKCNFGTCGECISYALDKCIWCTQDEFDVRRCRSESYLKINTTWCNIAGARFNPEVTSTVIEDQNFTTVKDGIKVQLKPQLIKMKVRPGIPMQFDMSFRPAQDFPLDVYYLMDISDTMKKRTTDLKTQAEVIHKVLSNYSNNVKLGIGSFVEKPGFPFFDSNRHKGHAFKNDVSLTDNMTQFASMIDNIKFGSNFDDPEAGLDALMQAMKCDRDVGWRRTARRIIVLCTDSPYHSAGDGKIVGAIEPHDMECHLENNIYTMALILDYPSVSQIAKVATDENFRIIFAIAYNNNTNKLHREEYEALIRQIEGSRFATLEDENSVIKRIKEAYEQLGNAIPMKIEAPSYVEVTIDQDCDSKPTRNCESPHKQTVNITGTLTVKSCPTDSEPERKVKIIPSGQDDKLVIELDIDCTCDCEKAKGEPTVKCHGAGFIQCGICKCNPGSYGAECQCNGTSTDRTDLEKCKFDVNDKNLCSGRGKCRCGKCEECKTGYSGNFCEFDDNSCPSPNNLPCSKHGECIRGQCQCHPHWSRNDCSCTDENTNCIAPYSNQVCSGRGVCDCGVCKCDALEGKNETYSGAFCDNCEECAEKRCIELENYALCNYMHMDNRAYCDDSSNVTTTQIGVSFLNKTEFNGPKLYMAKWCKKDFDSHNGTYIVFKYQYENHDLRLTIQKELELPPQANIWIAAGSAIGLVLLIGIITVIVWKVLVDLHDKREYDKFQNEALAAGYDVSQNPLYLDPSVNFANPVYNNQCN